MNLPHLAQRLFNTPLALHPSKAEVIMASVMDRFGITKIESSLAMDDDWYSFDDSRGRDEALLRRLIEAPCVRHVQKSLKLRVVHGSRPLFVKDYSYYKRIPRFWQAWACWENGAFD